MTNPHIKLSSQPSSDIQCTCSPGIEMATQQRLGPVPEELMFILNTDQNPHRLLQPPALFRPSALLEIDDDYSKLPILDVPALPTPEFCDFLESPCWLYPMTRFFMHTIAGESPLIINLYSAWCSLYWLLCRARLPQSVRFI